MSENPFDDEQGTFVALVNSEGQYSLWPTFAAMPAGWTPRFGPADRASCLAHIEQVWTDLRPASLVERMDRAAADQAHA